MNDDTYPLPFLSLSLSLPPFSPHTHTHYIRIGRTGRFGRSGLAINFVDGPRSKKNMQEIESHFGRRIEKLDIDDPDKVEEAIASWTHLPTQTNSCIVIQLSHSLSLFVMCFASNNY